jgi:hypothetical protein
MIFGIVSLAGVAREMGAVSLPSVAMEMEKTHK